MAPSLVRATLKTILPRALWDRMRLLRVKSSAVLFRPRWVTHSFEGQSLKVLIADPVGAEWYDRGGWPERAETRMLRERRLKPGATVFDLGAHQAVVAGVLGRIVGPGGKVVAVEASAANVRVGRQILEANELPQVRLVHAAVAAKRGTLHFNENFNGQVDDGKGALGRVKVPALSIDDLAEEHGAPDLVVIDIEGFECEAMLGAARTLGRRPDFFIEVHSHEDLSRFGGSVGRLLSFFEGRDYELLAGDSAEFEGFKPVDEQVRRTRKPFSLLAFAR